MPAGSPSDGMDATLYVPRLSLELALAELSELIGKTPACAALTGEAGLGKTLLLHVLRERLSGAFECLYLPLGRLDPNQLWSSVSVAIGLGSGDDDRGAVLGRARSLAADGSGLVLLVDDAGAIPAALQAELIAACETPGLSLVLALAAGELPEQSALPTQVRRIDLGPPMSLAETRAYVQARLRQLEPEGSIHTLLGARAIEEMHDASGGVPARLEPLLEARRHGFASEGNMLPPEPPPAELEPQRPSGAASQPASATLEAERAAAEAYRGLRMRFERPSIQLGAALLFVVAIGGFWYFALQRAGTPSVGVPVERFQAPRPAPAPTPPPTAEQTPAVSAPAPAPAPRPAPNPSEKAVSVPAPTGPAKPLAATAPARREWRWLQLLKRSEIAIRATARE